MPKQIQFISTLNQFKAEMSKVPPRDPPAFTPLKSIGFEQHRRDDRAKFAAFPSVQK